MAFFINSHLAKNVIKIAKKKGLFIIPGPKDSHNHPVPALGGISIFIVTFFTLLLVIGSGFDNSAGFFLASSFLLAIIGIKDDLVGSQIQSKFIIQIVSAFLFVINPDFALGNLGGFLGIHLINPNFLSYVLGIFIIVFIMNAYNFIDGVDGLCSFLGMISSITFCLVFYSREEYLFCIFSIVLSGCLTSSIIFNFKSDQNKMFLGDNGALLIGFLISIFALRIIEGHPVKPFIGYQPINSLLFILISLVVPIIDILRVIVLRLNRGQKPWHGDKEHIHHLLIRRGYSHIQITLILGGLQILAILGLLSLGFNNLITIHFYFVVLLVNIPLIIYVFPIKSNLIKGSFFFHQM
jgi:UDP-N-acetylmuramyl pentapeptide phosphotransferase/UDP-N-acetylglucosamine-1-phosphate transferase